MNGLINRKATRKFILEKAKVLRPGWDCKRVSEFALDDLEIMYRAMICKWVKSHPTKGVTFMIYPRKRKAKEK